MDVKATLETKISKSGKEYQVLMVKLTDTYSKPVFLEQAELELLKVNNSKVSKTLNDPFGK